MKEALCIIRKKITTDDIGKDCFITAYEDDCGMLKKISYGKEILVKTIRSRNPRHHKLIFGIAKKCIEHAKDDSILSKMTQYDFIKACMRAELIVDMKFNFDGSIDYETKHINFYDMDEDEFQLVSDAIFKWGSFYLEIEEYELRRNYQMYLG